MRVCFTLLLLVVLLSACTDETRRFRQYEVHGIDVSHYQSKIDWEKVAAQSIEFAFIKASEGQTYQDSLFQKNWAAIKEVGLKRGAYHFFRPKVPAMEQAENFAEAVQLEAGDLPPVLDVEVMDGVSKIELINNLRTWLYVIEIKYGVKPIIYTNLKFYYQYLAGHFDEYPLWVARYSSWKPKLPAEKEWVFWQYGNKGRLEGIKGDVDFNVFQGGMEELERLCVVPRPVTSYLLD